MKGATAREVLRHKTVERLVMVDIDQEVVETCQKYLPEWNNGAYEDKRMEVVFEDINVYLKETKEEWDVIILDLPDPTEGKITFNV
jgi:spermidine synthase